MTLSFNPFDPFEDTERHYTMILKKGKSLSFNPFDPFEDTERQERDHGDPQRCGFNPFDPFEDTESPNGRPIACPMVAFQPLRSV